MKEAIRQRALYVGCDFVATNIAWLLFNVSRWDLLPWRTATSLASYLTSRMVVTGQVLFPLLMLGVYWLSGYYNHPFRKSRLEELTSTFSTTLIGAVIIFFAVLLNDMTDDLLLDWGLFGLMFGLLFALVYLGRWINTSAVIRRLQSGRLGFDTIVFGPPERIGAFAAGTTTLRSMGFRLTGAVTGADPTPGDAVGGIPVIAPADVDRFVTRTGVRNIVVLPSPSATPESTLRLLNRLFPLECQIYVDPDESHMLISRPRTRNIVGDPLIDISRTDMPQATLNAKRLGDIVGAAVALVVLSPLLAAIAVAVRLDSRGPVFYRQRRVGYHKRPFDIIKFRTMVPDAEAGGPSLSQGDDDPRITRVGRVLRKYRLDELPQFVNVLRGEMSVVGPRPERAHYISQILERAPYYTLLHQVRPGITSWGMVRYGYAANVGQMVERLRYDLLYLENVSLTVDLKIIFYTVSTVLKGKGK